MCAPEKSTGTVGRRISSWNSSGSRELPAVHPLEDITVQGACSEAAGVRVSLFWGAGLWHGTPGGHVTGPLINHRLSAKYRSTIQFSRLPRWVGATIKIILQMGN